MFITISFFQIPNKHHHLVIPSPFDPIIPFPNSPPAMGCCCSTSNDLESPDAGNDGHHNAPAGNIELQDYPLPLPPPPSPARETGPSQTPEEESPPFPGFPILTLGELMAATDGFSVQKMLSNGGDEHPNFVYKGRLHDRRQIAIKRFSTGAWPDADEFREEAIKAGRLRHRRLVKLIGYCCEADERLLVAEFMPNTLTKHLSKVKTMDWSRCLRVACYIAEALEYCINEGQTLYHDLNSNNVLFDEITSVGNPYLSCFGLAKNSRDGRSYSTNSAYMPPECLNDKGATALTQLASPCLRNNPKDRPTIEVVNGILALCQSNAGAPSNAMPGTQEQDKTPPMLGAERQDKTSQIQGTQKQDKTPLMLSSPKKNTTPLMQGTQKQDKTPPMLSSPKKNTTPLMQGTQKQDKTPPMPSSPMQDAALSMQGIRKQDRTPQTPPVPQPTSSPMAEAVARMDFTAIHHILVLARYDADEASEELSFKDWTTHMMEMLETRKRGDSSFRDKDFKTAITCYSQMRKN